MADLTFKDWYRDFPTRYAPVDPYADHKLPQKIYRFAALDCSRAKDETRTCEAVLSTETGVFRGGYTEVLRHDDTSVDLSRAADGLPLLWSHDPAQHIGTVENIRIHNHQLRGRLRFSESPLGQEKFADVKAGILRGLSIGYQINDYETRDGDGIRQELIATRWLPFECSAVSIAADTAAGIGRALQFGELPGKPESVEFLDAQQAARNFYKGYIESIEELPEAEKAVAEIQRQLLAATTAADLEETRELMRATWEFARDLPGVTRDGAKLIYRKEVPLMEKYQPFFNLKTTRGDNPENFSLCRAIAMTFDPVAARQGGMEFEIMQDARRLSGKRGEGFTLPENALFRSVTKGGTGGNVIGVDHLGGQFVGALRERLITGRLGATILPGLQQDVTIPRGVADSTASWIAGDGSDAVSSSDPTFDQITLQPKTLGAYVTLSRKMLLQSDPAAEQLVRNSLSFAVAKALDTAALNGSGAANQPLGILGQTGIFSDTHAGTPTFAELVDLEGALMVDDADMGNMGYCTTGALAAALKQTEIVSTTGQMIWTATGEGEGRVNGYRALVSNIVPTGTVIFGNWSDLLIGLWSGLDILTDPYTRAAYGDVVVTILQDCDIAVRHGESFAEVHPA